MVCIAVLSTELLEPLDCLQVHVCVYLCVGVRVCVCMGARVSACLSLCVGVLAMLYKATIPIFNNREYNLWTIHEGTNSRGTTFHAQTCNIPSLLDVYQKALNRM